MEINFVALALASIVVSLLFIGIFILVYKWLKK
ncbi:MAG: hypothetical protein ACFWUF_11985 [Lactococcus lactis]|nr:prophage protein [Lactococcus lactis subsp. lactis]KHE77173.1 hypothetical protein N489_05505 [Lactococcus lactis subsp. lactis 1AA59]